MILITGWTTDFKQKQTVSLSDGTILGLEIEYKPQQQGWYFTSLSRGSFLIQGMRIITSPNMLRQFKNQIPFGLACYVTDNQEPTLVQDFVTGGRANLYILSSAEVLTYEKFLNGQITA